VASGEVLDLVGQLADKSLVLVRRGWHGDTRYRMLETVRDYGHERLVEAGERAATLERYAAWILGRSPVSSAPAHPLYTILGGGAGAEGERPTVTVLAVDLCGSTFMWEHMDPEAMVAMLKGCHARITDAVRRHEGTIAQFLGDGVLVLFGAPIAQKDSARRAVVAALEMQRALQAYSDEVLMGQPHGLRHQVGLDTAPVAVSKVGDDLGLDYVAIGDAANVAAHLLWQADPGAVYLSDRTYRALHDDVECEPVGALRVRGRGEPVVAYRAIRVK
jgi:class 3 adenylate cyclase